MKVNYFFAVLFSFTSTTIGQTIITEDPQKIHHVGYSKELYIDSSRIYKTGSSETDILHYRPVAIDLWYPATIDDGSRLLSYGDLLKTFKERAERFTGQSLTGFDSSLAKYLVQTFGGTDSLSLLRHTTKSFKQAKPLEAKFPLILYLCSYNGAAHENVDLFETLASKGYVVATVMSNGRYPGDMTMQAADLLQQVDDGRFILNLLLKKRYIDTSRIGLVGYSWGGPAAAILAMDTNFDFKAFVSLDGSERHFYGENQEEDSLWNNIRYSDYFDTTRFSLPYLYLSSDRGQPKADSVYYLTKKANSTYEQIDSATHADFACYVRYINPIRNKTNLQKHDVAIKRCAAFLDRWLSLRRGKNQL